MIFYFIINLSIRWHCHVGFIVLLLYYHCCRSRSNRSGPGRCVFFGITRVPLGGCHEVVHAGPGVISRVGAMCRCNHVPCACRCYYHPAGCHTGWLTLSLVLQCHGWVPWHLCRCETHHPERLHKSIMFPIPGNHAPHTNHTYLRHWHWHCRLILNTSRLIIVSLEHTIATLGIQLQLVWWM